jgi:tetratricopeptide (TPR) repeat protein
MFSDYFGHYMPLTWLTLGFDYVLWGMNPVGYHVTSLAFHALNAVLCFFVLYGLFRRGRPGDDPAPLLWAAAAGALFFSIHPLRVESVAWITERRDLTSGCFFFLTLLAYLRMTGEESGTAAHRKWLALSVLAFVGSCLCKAMGMTLPLVLLLLDVWPLKRIAPGRTAAVLREKIPFFLLMGVAIVATGIGQRHAKALYSYEDYPLSQMLGQPGYRISFYVLKTLLPFNLSPLYFYLPQMGVWHVVGWAVVLGVTALVLLRRRQQPAAAVAWIAFGLLIAPVSGFAQAGPHFAADRYTYLACLPFAALFSVAVLLAGPDRRRIAGVAAGALLAGLGVLTLLQCRVWSDSLTLWNRVVDREPDIYFSLQNRGSAKSDLQDWHGAIADFSRSIELNPAFPKTWYNRGVARASLGDHAGAIEDFSRSLRLEPRQPGALSARGLSRSKLGDRTGAAADCDEAVRMGPDLYQPVLHRGLVRLNAGDAAGAVADFTRAIDLQPEAGVTYYNRGLALARSGRPREALADFTRALELNPVHAEALAQRGIAKMMLKDPAGGIEDLTASLRLKPEASTFLLRASSRALQGDLPGAEGDCTEAIRLKPENADAYVRRGAARLELGHRTEAAQDFQKALDLAPAGWPQQRATEEFLRRARTP